VKQKKQVIIFIRDAAASLYADHRLALAPLFHSPDRSGEEHDGYGCEDAGMHGKRGGWG